MPLTKSCWRHCIADTQKQTLRWLSRCRAYIQHAENAQKRLDSPGRLDDCSDVCGYTSAAPNKHKDQLQLQRSWIWALLSCDTGWTTLRHWVLSTSNTNSARVSGFVRIKECSFQLLETLLIQPKPADFDTFHPFQQPASDQRPDVFEKQSGSYASVSE